MCTAFSLNTNPSKKKWNEALSKLDALNNLHLSYEYGEFCKKILGNYPIRLIGSYNDTVSILQAFRSTSGFLPLCSIEIGGMDGPGFATSQRATSDIVFLTISELSNHVRESFKGLQLFNCHLSKNDHEKYGCYLVRAGYQAVGKSYTAILNLSEGEESVWKHMDKKFRNAIRQGKKREVTVREVSSEHDLFQFHLIKKRYKYLEGSPLSHWAIFKKRIELALKMKIMKVFTAEVKGEVAAAAAIWTYGKSIGYGIGSLNRTFQWYRPMNVLQWHVIEWAMQNGYERYNLWGLDPTQNTLIKFKLGLGATIQSNFNYLKFNLNDFNVGLFILPFKNFFPAIYDLLCPLLH